MIGPVYREAQPNCTCRYVKASIAGKPARGRNLVERPHQICLSAQLLG